MEQGRSLPLGVPGNKHREVGGWTRRRGVWGNLGLVHVVGHQYGEDFHGLPMKRRSRKQRMATMKKIRSA